MTVLIAYLLCHDSNSYYAYVLRSVVPGTYRLLSWNHCRQYGVVSEEFKSMEDGDMATCESLGSPTNATFGIFSKDPWRRSVVVIVYGFTISCSPIDGIGLTIFSNSYQRYRCKAYKLKNEDKCQYKCPCPIPGQCNHVAIILTSMGITSENSQVCEFRIFQLL